MSTIKANTWLNTDGTENFKCRAWASYNGNSNVLNASGNITSVTDNGTGDYTFNFTNAMEDTDYAVCGECSSGTRGRYGWKLGPTKTVSGFNVYGGDWGSTGFTAADMALCNIAVFR